MKFTCIDFETALPSRNSACQLGIAVVENNEIIETKSWLIKPNCYPEFGYFNMAVHGITPEDVSESPELPEIWCDIKPYLENRFLIAHNASFDMSVLRNTLDYYNIPYPNSKYCCTYHISKSVLEGLPSYDLKTLCHYHDIKLVNHHSAEFDARATAELSILIFNKLGISSPNEIPILTNNSIGELFPSSYVPSRTKKVDKKNKSNTAVSENHLSLGKLNPESIFYEEVVVFTGKLLSMPRVTAQKIIEGIGGFIGKGVTKKTKYLIVGLQDYKIVGDDGMSSKQEKAIKMIESGADLEILSEEEFLKNL